MFIGFLFAIIIGAIIGGTLQEVLTGSPNRSGGVPMPGVIIGGVAPLAISLIWVVLTSQRKRRGQARAERAREQAEMDRRRSQEQQSRSQLENRLLENLERAQREFAEMPSRLRAANTEAASAVRYFNDGAFSPFWSAIERAYVELGAYRSAVEALATLATGHADEVARLAELGGNAGALAVFPVRIDQQRNQDLIDSATRSLSDMVYQAQKLPTFAQIWEQRRTTAAVVAGFSNLETAVSRLGSSLSGSIRSLSESLSASSSRVDASVKQMSGSLTTLTQEQNRHLGDMARLSEKTFQELHHQTWGHYSLT